MADERLAALRQALDDAVLTRTGRSIGDLASERVLVDIMPEIEALLGAREAAMRVLLREVIDVDERGVYINTYDDGYYADCQYCGATSHEPGHKPGCLITKARALLGTPSQE